MTGTVGSAGLPQDGGAYNLLIAADPADAPTRVLGSALQWGDPLASSPTGLVLAFSGPIDVNSLIGTLSNTSALRVVDQSGNDWALTPSTYQESQGQVSFVFDQPLPPGRYSLVDSAAGGLTDLAGRMPVSPGLPQGVLASWTVPTLAPKVAAGNVGFLWPSLQDGVSRSATIAPGPWAVNRVVVPFAGLYTLQTNVTQGTLAIRSLGDNGSVVIDPGTQGPSHTYTLDLKPGAYVFSLGAVGPETVKATWQLKPALIDHESLINNGVAQTSALSLRFISFDASNLTPGLQPGPSSGPVQGDAGNSACAKRAPVSGHRLIWILQPPPQRSQVSRRAAFRRFRRACW